MMHKGKPVASGCLAITQEPFSVNNTEYRNFEHIQDLEQYLKLEQSHYENEVYKGMIQYLMMDEGYFKNTDPSKAI